MNIVATSLSDTTSTSNVTFTFSEAPVGFDASDITPTNGTVTGFTQDDATHYHATFTATDGFSGSGTVAVGTGYTDAAGNTGVAGSDAVSIDRANPTVAVDIVATSLSDGTPSSNVTFTFTEAVSGFDASDITPTNGTISGFAQDDATHYHATFTATDGFAGTGTVAVGTGYTDAVGNTGAAGSDTVSIDRANPNAPTITSVTDDVSPATGTLANNASTNDTNLTIKVSLVGTGAVAGDTIQLYNGSGTGSQLGTSYTLTGTDITNTFANLQTSTLTNGTTYAITARITDVAGNQSWSRPTPSRRRSTQRRRHLSTIYQEDSLYVRQERQ